MADSSSVKKLDERDWLRTLYVETWKARQNDEALAQTRGTIFTGILATIVALLGALSIQVVKIPCWTVQHYKIAPGIVILGLFWFLADFVMGRLLTSFDNVTKACRLYLNARGANLRAIEAAADLGVFAPAMFENEWREKSKEQKDIPGAEVIVLAGDPELEKLTKIGAYNFKGGYSFLSEVVGVFRTINRFLRWAGITLIFVGAFGLCVKLPLCP